MGTQIKKIAYPGTNYPLLKRSQGVLSDGTSVSMVLDMNQTGLPGSPGGDSTGIPKIYVYTSADNVTWTLRATVNFPAATTARSMASMTVDSSNNVHIAFRAGDGSVRYVRLTYGAGPTFSVGVQETALAIPAANNSYQRIDIDVIGTGTANVVVASYVYSTASLSTSVLVSGRSNTGTWANHNFFALSPAGKGVASWTEDVSIAGNRTAVTADQAYVVTATRKGSTSDQGDVIFLGTMTLSTGAQSGSHVVVRSGFANGLGLGHRNYWVFCTAVNEFTVAGSVSAEPWQMMAYRFTYTAALGAVGSTPISISTSRGSLARTYFGGWNTVAYAGNGKLCYIGKNAERVFSCVATISGSTVSWQPGFQYWDNRYSYGSPAVVPVAAVTSGASWNNSATAVTAQMWFDKLGTSYAYSVQQRSHLLPSAPANVLPGTNSVVSSDRPALSADFKYGLKYPQLRQKMEWQFATDAGFTTNVRSVLQDDAKYKTPTDTASPVNAREIATDIVPAAIELYQAIWYVRARSVDELGSYGPYSTGKTFTVAHKPVATDLLPSTDKVVLYGVSGSMTFSWKFSDPSPTDTQTGYQIIIENAANGTTVLDTGKLSSTLTQAQVNIPGTAKDVLLRWKVRLWDSDDVMGPDSDYRVFTITDPPVPTITNPTGAAVLTTAIPLITWTNAIGGSRTQDSYRIIVSRGSAVLHITNWIKSTDTSYQLPLGILDNNLNYSFTVWVRDNLALEGGTTMFASTSWVVPAGPTGGCKVWTSEYNKRGFIYVTWNSATRDADFTAWNVYRRKVGDTKWTLMQSLPVAKDFLAFRDYGAASETTYEYVVVQAVNRFGDIVESVISTTVMVKPSSDSYWLLNQLDASSSMPLYLVTAESFTNEYEEEEYTIIGRGRHVDIGDRVGYSGTMTAQLRDKFTTGAARYNYALNPSLIYSSAADGMPDRWSLTTAGTVGNIYADWIDTDTPPPSGQTPFKISADNMYHTSSTYLKLSQDLTGSELPAAILLSGATYTLTMWVFQVNASDNANKVYRLDLKFLTAGGSSLGAFSSTASFASGMVESSVAAGVDQPGNPTGQWRRIQLTGTTTAFLATAGKITIELTLIGNTVVAGGTASYMTIGGVQLEAGSRTAYIDGTQFDAEWNAVPYLSSSLSTGYYTARKQRLNLEKMKARKGSVYLRNPFGDIWTVMPGNIAITRIPGTGKNEFADAEIPYREVGF